MSLLAQLATFRGRLLWRSFEDMTQRPEDVQQRLLLRLLADNKDTAFGKQHGFDRISGPKDYRAAVPVADYEGFRPWIDRLAAGQRRMLTAEEPHMFALSSGTTAEPKLIPVNRSTKRSSSRLSARWLYRCLADHPNVLDRKALAVVSPAIEGHTAAGVPFGSASGYIYQNASRAIRSRYAVPYEVFAIKDFEAKYYTIVRFSIEQRVSLIATPNPSTVLRLLEVAAARSEELIKDIRDGTLTCNLDPSVGAALAAKSHLKPNPERARELERLTKGGRPLNPSDYWPDLTLVGCWKGGSVGATLDRVKSWFSPIVAFRDIGYLSSEAQASLPIQDEGSAGILALDTNYYEFVAEDNIDDEPPETLTVGQVAQGATYYIVMTSPTGLYRYDINDVVRVTGFYNKTPLLEFIRKGRDMVNLTGEKLHVGQLIRAVKQGQHAVGLDVEYYRAVGNAEMSRYDLKLELRPEHEQVTDDVVIRLVGAIDHELAELNVEYDQKRRSGRLHPPHVHLMSKGWASRRLQAKIQRANRDAQVKDTLLGLPDEDDLPSEVIRELDI